jgi:hypothetical protein
MVQSGMRRRGSTLLVMALFAALLPLPAAAQSVALSPGGTFWDDDGNSHEGMIEAIVAADITQGCTGDGRNYCPSVAVNRGQMASFLARALDLPAAERDYFTDDAGSVHQDGINRVAAAGIASGTGSGRFEPLAPVTRAQMATFLSNALELPASERTGRFQDVAGTHADNIERVAAAEITLGCDATGTRYCPSTAVLRGQMASFLGRALGLEANVPPSRALTEGVRTVRRYMDAIAASDYRTAQNLSTGVARGFADYVVKFTQIVGLFGADESVTVTTENSSVSSLGDRRWRLNMTLRWTVDDEFETSVRQLSDFVVRQQADGTFRVESYRRDGLALSSYVRTGNIAASSSGRPVTGRLVAQFRRADLPRPEVVNIVAVTNTRRDWIGIDDGLVNYTTRSDNQNYVSDVGLYPEIRPGQTQEILLITPEIRAPHSAADLVVMAYGPDPSGFEFEQLLAIRIPDWPR